MNEVLKNGSRPSPTPSNLPATARNPLTVADLPNANTESEIRCFCGYDLDDGFTIQCDRCSHWQHGSCVNIKPTGIPDIFICYYCEVRGLQQSDIVKARETQAKKIGGEPKKTQAQGKRGTGTSHRRRDANGTGHSRSYSESASHKLQHSKDHPTGKSRGRQRPISTQAHTNLPDTSASPDEHSPTGNAGKSPSIERELGSDSEVPPSVYTKEYSPITCNTIVSAEVDDKIKTWTHDAINNHTKTAIGLDTSLPCIPRRYSGAEFNDLIPSGHTVRWVSSPEELSSLGLPLIRLVADTPSKADQFVIEYVGEIGSKTSYMQDALNQYVRIRHPKAFVLFHPQLPIYIDARRCGSEARFVRRSCRPNLKFETMVIDGTNLKFALYTNQPIERGVELTVGWEWDNTLPFTRLLEADATVDELDPELLQKMRAWAETITSTVGECACPDSDLCIMARLKGETPVGKPKKVSKAGTKRRWREMQEPNSTGREVSPEKHDLDAKYKRRSSSTSSHRKSESRDRTPTYITADITQSSVITDQNSSAREARKMKDAVSLIEKLTNPESSHSRGKRVKRSGLPPAAQSAVTLDVPEKLPKPAADQGPMTSPSAVGQTPGPHKTLHSNQSSPGKQVNGASPPRASPKVSYVDGGVQTDTDVTTHVPTHSLPTSRKLRILAQFRAQSAQRESTSKSQLAIVKEEELSPKEVTSVIDGDAVMVDTQTEAALQSPVLKLEPKQAEPIGNMEMDIDAAAEPLADNNTSDTSSIPPSVAPTVASAPKTTLSVQLPPTPPFPSANVVSQNTMKQALPTPSASSTSPISPFQPQTPNLPPVTNTAQPALPTPPAPSTGRKKMSLSDYTRKKAESLEKDKVGSQTNHLTPVADNELEANGARSTTPGEPATPMDLDTPNPNISVNGVRGS
ncbi:hypothetical protein TWF730_004076 [Orbilia blumenaviensis]|uniref:SET domain-containing protein n=1 Tax=Orbilia blumenaviensis TaxID=1796055 RepID=A0AAV9U1Y5_9PEZI